MFKSISFFLALQLLSRASYAQLICLNIQAIQGTGTVSSRLGDIVKVCGATVTSVQFGGFTMQMPPADPNYPSSSAMYVRTFNNLLKVGDFVNVEGTVFEFTGRTVLDRVYVTKRGTTSTPFPMVEIQLPVNSVADYQRYESMQVKIVAKSNHDMVIADYEQFDFTDSIGVCSVAKSKGRPYQYTTDHAPNAAGYAAHNTMLVHSCLNVIGNTRDFLYRIDTFENRIRGGSLVTVLQGTLGITVNADRWEIAPAVEDNFQYTITNPRVDAPKMNGADVVVVSSNLGTYNAEEDGAEFDKQVAKIIPGLVQMDADIYAVQGIVTDSPGGEDIATRLNTETNGRIYKGVKAEMNFPTLGNGATRVDIIFDSNKLTLLGADYLNDASLADSSILTDSTIGTIFDQPYPGSSFPLIASFVDKKGDTITVVSMQFTTRKFGQFLFEIIGTPDRDRADGAGDFNLLRTLQAQALMDWIKMHPTGITLGAVVVAGSPNAFKSEDPIGVINSAGYKYLTGIDSYNYGDSQGFGTTDYIFVKDDSNAANDKGQVWHVNADEIPIISYKNCVQAGYCRDDPSLFDSSVPARFARRDPLIAGIYFNNGGGGGGLAPGFCFSGATMVETRSGPLRMRDLKLGDEILVAEGVFEQVYSFGHYNDTMESQFLKFMPSGLEITPAHIVFVEGKAVPAALVKVGDMLSGDAVTSIKTVTRKGVFAPFTASGSVIVNDVVASNYVAFRGAEYIQVAGVSTPFSYNWVAHIFNSVHRIAYKIGFTGETYTESGVSQWVAGPHMAGTWLLEQNVFIALALLIPAIALFGSVSLIEASLNSPVTAATVVVSAVSLAAARRSLSVRRSLSSGK